jgi:cell division protein FtsL
MGFNAPQKGEGFIKIKTMANQQLIDYIKQQFKVGVSKVVIRDALIAAGWTQTDIEDAMKSFEVKIPSAIPSIVTSDIFQPKDMPIFEPGKSKSAVPSIERSRSAEEIKKEETSKPKSESVIQIKDTVVLKKSESKAEPQPKPFSKAPATISLSVIKNSPWRLVLMIVMAAVIIALAGIGVILYKNNLGLQKQIEDINISNGKLENTIISLNQTIKDSNTGLTALKAEKEDLEAQLLIFAILSTSTEPMPVTVKGLLSGGEKTSYSVTTAKGITVYVKNSKEANVNSALKPFLGTNIEISGTHAQGSRDITVAKINNQEIPQKTKSTISTSTTP